MYDVALPALIWLLTISSAIVSVTFGVNADRMAHAGHNVERAIFVVGSIVSGALTIMLAYWLGEMGAH